MANKRGGQPGNNNAAKGRRLSAVLRKRLEERAKEAELMDTLLDKALDGDMAAIKEVFDRIDGKARQDVSVDADVTVTNAKELTDEQLLSIANRGSD